MTNFKDLKINNDYIFSKVMVNEEICLEVIELLKGIKLTKVEYMHDHKFLKTKKNSKAIELDILLFDGEKYYIIEMQNYYETDLIKRSNYYRSIINSYLLKQGEGYELLPEINIIFICTYDCMGKRLPKYTLNTICNQTGEIITKCGVDEFFNTKSHEKVDEKGLRNLLSYFNGGKPTDKLTKKMEKIVNQLKSSELLEEEYMKFECDLQDRLKGAEKAGELRGKLEEKLTIAKKMIDTQEVSYISELFDLQEDYIHALIDGISIEEIVKNHFNFN